jgi:hypothetical protein
MPNFADDYQHKCLLEISRRHRDAVDPARVYDGKVIGQDNWDNLAVSTVFAAIAIEAALNHYVQSHCLFLEGLYLQEVFGGITKQFLHSSIHNKIKILLKCWPEPIANNLRKDVEQLISIRNRITHQTGEFETASKAGTVGVQCPAPR